MKKIIENFWSFRFVLAEGIAIFAVKFKFICL